VLRAFHPVCKPDGNRNTMTNHEQINDDWHLMLIVRSRAAQATTSEPGSRPD
jgi:hypothetical protein